MAQWQVPTDADRERFATALFEASQAGEIDDEEYARRLTRLGLARSVAAMAAVVEGTDLLESDPAPGAPGAAAMGGALPAPAGRELDAVDLALLMRKSTPAKGRGAAPANRYKALIIVGVLFFALVVLGVLLAVFVHPASSSTTPVTIALWRELVAAPY